MQSHDTMQHRNTQTSVLEQRQANGTLKPFIGALQGWNGKVARLRALADSVYSTEEDKALARFESSALVAEIRRGHTQLHAAIKGEPPHSRLGDVDAAFRRLIDQLRMMSAGAPSEATPPPAAGWGVHQQDEQS